MSRHDAVELLEKLCSAKIVILHYIYSGYHHRGLPFKINHTFKDRNCSCASSKHELRMGDAISRLLGNDAFRLRISLVAWNRIKGLTWENQGRKLAETHARWLEAWDVSRGCLKDEFWK